MTQSLARTMERNARANERDRGSAIPCEVTRIHLDEEPRVDVRPLRGTKIFGVNGDHRTLPALEVKGIPYVFPSSPRFAVFMPPAVGQQGLLVVSHFEIGESAGTEIARVRDRASGEFIPTGVIDGSQNPFIGSPAWAEMRSAGCRVAISDDTIHLQSGTTNATFTAGRFDINVGGISLVKALHQMSDHIAALEDLIHTDGTKHGGRKSRLVDDLLAALAPVREESGVR